MMGDRDAGRQELVVTVEKEEKQGDRGEGVRELAHGRMGMDVEADLSVGTDYPSSVNPCGNCLGTDKYT